MKTSCPRFALACAVVACLLAAVATPVSAQDGVSSSSVSMFRSGIVRSPEAILVEDFFNHHRHDIKLPEEGEAIALDLRWGTNLTNKEHRDAYLQVGLATQKFDDTAELPPLNLSIVIDRSGSMAGERIAKVKEALLAFVHKLRSVDRVSIIVFSDQAEVLVAPQVVEDTNLFQRAIGSVVADGSTNLCAGLMLGYEQVKEHFDAEKTNRVILLTDGLANRGVTDSEQITSQSKAFNDEGIDLSTIGVGTEFNYELMRQLARAGRGLIHFVGDDEDIDKVFVDELQSLLAQSASDVNVEIKYGEDLSLLNAYGYAPTYKSHSIRYSLDNLNAGATQVMLSQLQVKPGIERAMEIPVTVTLSYHDRFTNSDLKKTDTIRLRFEPDKEIDFDPLTDRDVRKNITIAQLATSLRETSKLIQDDKCGEAKMLIDSNLAMVRERFRTTLDEDLKRMMTMGEDYASELEKFISRRDARARDRDR